MTVIVYQDGKLYTDTTAFTDYSDAVSQVKWEFGCSKVTAFAGLQEDIGLMFCSHPSRQPTELAIVSVDWLPQDGPKITYAENGGKAFPVIPLDDRPLLFANNALRAIVKNYMDTVYTWDEPIMVAMVKAGVFPAVVELSPADGHHYLHKIGGSEVLSDCLKLTW